MASLKELQYIAEKNGEELFMAGMLA